MEYNPVMIGLLVSWMRTRDPAMIEAASPMYREYVATIESYAGQRVAVERAAMAAGLDPDRLYGYGLYRALAMALMAGDAETRASHLQGAEAGLDKFLSVPEEDR